MSALMYESENLREEALRFAARVHRNPAVAADQELVIRRQTDDQEVLFANDDYRQLLEAVELRFLNRPDGAEDTHARFMELVRSYFNGRRTRSRLHADVCILFICHNDLFNRFERLRFFNDGREETRRQIMEWRNNVRDEIMAAIRVELTDFLSAIARLNLLRVPQVMLYGRNLDFIARTCFPTGVDPYNVMGDLVTDPVSVRHLVLPTLKRKQALFQRLENLLADYFVLVTVGDL